MRGGEKSTEGNTPPPMGWKAKRLWVDKSLLSHGNRDGFVTIKYLLVQTLKRFWQWKIGMSHYRQAPVSDHIWEPKLWNIELIF